MNRDAGLPTVYLLRLEIKKGHLGQSTHKWHDNHTLLVMYPFPSIYSLHVRNLHEFLNLRCKHTVRGAQLTHYTCSSLISDSKCFTRV